MRYIRRLLHLCAWEMAFLAVSAAALLTFCLNGTIAIPFVIYFSYLYSTYALIAACVFLTDHIRRYRATLPGQIEAVAMRYRLLGQAYRLLADPGYRTEATLWPSLTFNLLFALFKLISGAVYRSAWIIAVGLYYAVLAALRTYLLRRWLRRQGGDPARVYRNTALGLMALTISMSVIMAQAVLDGQHYEYAGVLIYAFALYAFVKIATATSALMKYRRDENRLLAAAKCISFACALMSMLSLQTALISRFGDDGTFSRTANLIAGAVVCGVMLVMCGRMLWGGNGENSEWVAGQHEPILEVKDFDENE